MWATGGAVSGVVETGGLLLVTRVWQWWQLRWWMVLALAVVVAGQVVVVPLWRYAVHRWEATDTALYTQTGWWTVERRIAPMSRIQTVDYSESATERLFGLATVTVTTASAAGALSVAGLHRQRARELAEELTARADAGAGDAT